MNPVENQYELKAHELLEAELKPSETLVAYTQSKTGGFITGKTYNFGLTSERLLIMQTKKDRPVGPVLSIQRQNIQQITWSGIWSNLKFKLETDTLTYPCKGSAWKKRANEMAVAFSQLPPAATGDDSAKSLQQTKDFEALGLLIPAKKQLAKTIQIDPVLATHPDIVTLQNDLAEQVLALRVAAGFFAGTLLLLSLLALLGVITLNPIGVILLIATSYNLWQAKTSWRSWGIYLGIINMLFFTVGLMVAGAMLEVPSWLAFGAAVVVALTGKSSRLRTGIAIALYVLGHWGLLILAVIVEVAAMALSQP